MAHVGVRMRRIGADRLLRGGGQYVADLPLPGCLHAGFARSSHAHARIRSIDTAEAESVPGVVAVHKAATLPEVDRETRPPSSPQGMKGHGLFPLASDTVRHVGEPVAVVLAETRAALADAIDAVAVEYEPLTPVVDVERAMESGALVWDDVPDNVCVRTTSGYGDTEAAFAAADVTVEARFSWERMLGAALEARSVAAAPGGEHGAAVTLWDSTQAPHVVRRNLAEYFGMEEAAIRVVTPDVGGGFGPKGRIYPEEFVLTALALRHGRPVRWVGTRTEDLQTTGQGRGQIHYARLAARADGTVLGLHDRILQDAGAYTPTGLAILFNTVRHLTGPYHLPALTAEVIGVYTNKALSSALRGGGRPEGVYVMERLLDRLAARIGMDAVEIRRRNFLRRDEFPYRTGLEIAGTPVIYDSGDPAGYLDRALEAVNVEGVRARQRRERESGRYIGLGLAAFIESSGTGSEEAFAEIDTDGGIQISVGSPSTGQSHETVFAQIAADRLGADLRSITITGGDTAAAQGTGTFASRMTLDGGNAVARAATDLRARLLGLAADLLEAAPTDLLVQEGTIQVRGVPDRSVTFADLAREAERRGGSLRATARYEPEYSNAWAGGANAVVVEVEPETGRVCVVQHVVVHDSGVLINPAEVEGQVQGAVAHGIGNALLEGAVYDESGQFLTSTFTDYLLPGFGSVPEVEMVHLETPSPFNPEGVKGAGESGTIAVIPAIMNAIEDALAPFGVTMDDVPASTEDIVSRIQGRA